MRAIGASATLPSLNRMASAESFQPWLLRPLPVLSWYFSRPSSSGTASVVSHPTAASSGASRLRTSASGIPQAHASCSRVTHRAVASTVP